MLVGRHGSRWRHVIIEASVFVEENNQQRRVPQFFIRANRVVSFRDQLLAFHDVVRRMIVVLIHAEILWLDEDEIREFIRFTNIPEKLIDREVLRQFRGMPLMSENQRGGKIIVVNLPGPAGFVEAIKDGRLVLLEDRVLPIEMPDAVRHVNSARRGARQSKETIRPGWPGKR